MNTFEILLSTWISGNTLSVTPSNQNEFFRSVYDEERDRLRVEIDNLNETISEIIEGRIMTSWCEDKWIVNKDIEVVGYMFYNTGKF